MECFILHGVTSEEKRNKPRMPKRTKWKARKSCCLENATPYQNFIDIMKEFNQEYAARKAWSLCSTRQEQIVRECFLQSGILLKRTNLRLNNKC